MALTPSSMLPLGTMAPEFQLPDVATSKMTHLRQCARSNGLLVMFICNHCPYVLHVEQEIARLARDYQARGLGVVAISSNNIEKYPDDAPDKMREQIERAGFSFPYLFDESQATARAYRAECTPDFFLFNNELKCVYRGRLDDSRPGNGVPLSGKDLRMAIEAMLGGEPVTNEQFPSMGCNIKWK